MLIWLLLLIMFGSVIAQAFNMKSKRDLKKIELARIQKEIERLEAKEAQKEKASAPNDQSSEDTSSSD